MTAGGVLVSCRSAGGYTAVLPHTQLPYDEWAILALYPCAKHLHDEIHNAPSSACIYVCVQPNTSGN